MKFKKLCRSLLNEMPGQLDQLDYRKNPDAPIAASGVVQGRFHPTKDSDIKKASATKATETETGIESNALDTFRAKAGKFLDFLLKNKTKYKNVKDLEDTIKPLVGMIDRLNLYTKDSRGNVISEDQKKIIIIETGKEYKIQEVAKIIIDIINSYEKKFDLKLWEVNDPQWKELTKSGVSKKDIGFFAITLDKLSPIAKVPRQQTARQSKGKRYMLGLDKSSNIANNVWVIWRKLDKKGKEPESIAEFVKYLRTRHGEMSERSAASERGLGTTLQRESEEGNLPLKFIGFDDNGYPQFGDQLTFAEVRNTTIEELLELTGHYAIKDVIEGWDDNDPKYSQYDVLRFIARGATQEPRARTLRIKEPKQNGFFK